MSGIARRLADRYLPPTVRRLAVTTRDRRRDRRNRAARRGDQAGRDHNAVLEVLRRAGSPPDTVVAEVRELIASGAPHKATSVAAALRAAPETAAVGALASAIVSFHRGYVELAWHQFQDVPRDLWRRHATSEFVRAGIQVDRETALEEVRRLLGESPECLDARSWLHVVGAVYGVGDEDLARRSFAVLDALVGEREQGVPNKLVVQRDWLQRWMPAPTDGSRAAPGPRRPGVLRDHGLRPPEPDPGVEQHRRPRAEHRLARTPGQAPGASLRTVQAGPGRHGDPAARTRPHRDAAHRRRGRRRTADPRSTATPRRTPRSHRTPGRWASAGSCTASST